MRPNSKLGLASAALFGVAFGLIGCVDMAGNLKPYQGENISAVVGKIGFPTDQKQMLGHTVYVWKTGNRFAGGYCDISFATDSTNRISNISWDGNVGGCSGLLGRLE